MSDDLHIPMPGTVQGGRAPVSSSYRARRLDDGAVRRWVTVAAAGLGGVLMLGMVGWAVMGRKPAVVPVIEADSRPLRVKPENPGGQQFAGADDGGGSTGAERMAPAAEVPAPQALRAQMQLPATPTTPQAAAVASAPATAVPAPTAAAPAAVAAAPAVVATGPVPAGVSPLPDTPVRPASPGKPAGKPAVATVAPTAVVPAPGATAGSGTTQVQLAALDSEAAARAEWVRLSKRLPELLGSRALVVQKAERDGQAVWRVRTGGFSDTAEATGFCGKLRAKGASCTVASF